MDDSATTAATLRQLLKQTRPRTPSLGWPVELRRRVARHAAARREGGEGWTSIGRSLGVGRNSVRSWVEALDEAPRAGAMVPVIIAEPTTVSSPAPAPEPTVAAELVLVSPRGFRLEGLDVSAAITALERLG